MNENNPPMMLPNGYVYGYNVSRELLLAPLNVVSVSVFVCLSLFVSVNQKLMSRMIK